MQLIDLSHPMRSGQPGYPGDPPFEIEQHDSIAAAGYNLARICMGSHSGTHLDAPHHFFDHSRSVDEIPLEQLFGQARVLRIPRSKGGVIDQSDLEVFGDSISRESRLIIHTGWGRFYGKDGFFEDYPSLTTAAAHYLAVHHVRLLGMDMPGPGAEWDKLHKELLRPGVEIVIVESLANLERVPDEFLFAAFPLRIVGLDGCPVRAIGIVE